MAFPRKTWHNAPSTATPLDETGLNDLETRVGDETDSIRASLTGKQATSEKGQANGYAGLDGSGKVPGSQLAVSALEYLGTWNASTNTPSLSDGTGSKGDLYRVTTAGTQNLGSGAITFDIGDYAIHNGSSWEKADTTDAVSSVAGKTGAVSLTPSDVGATPAAHATDTTNPHSVTKAQVGLGNADNTADANKPISSATQTALDGATLKITRLGKQAERAPSVARILDKFLTTPTGLAVGRSGTTYSLYRGISPGLFSKFDLILRSTDPGNYPLHSLGALSVIAPMLSKPYGDASVASSGTWTTGTNVGAYNGGYNYSTASGASKTFTTPANTTAIGMRVPRLTNGGLYGKVTINGDATLADALPTAQDEVNAGRLASSALVANGGTLNPTDRIFHSYVSTSGATDYDVKLGLTAGLTAGVHTVVVTNTGYAVGGAASQRLYLAGFSYATATSTPADAGVVSIDVGVLNLLSSAWEHAVEFTPQAGSTPTFLGNLHGYEIEDSFTVEVDGVVTALADGQIVTATREVIITRVGELRHPDTGATKIADTSVKYRIARKALVVNDRITWQVAGSLTKAYAMLPLNGPTSSVSGAVKFTRAALLDYAAGTLTFTGGDGDVYRGKSKSAAAWVWGGKFGVLMHMPAVETYTNDWAASSEFTQVEDRNGTMIKVYIGRSWGTAEPVAAGDVHEHETQYTVGYFTGGAEASLKAL